MNKKFFERTGDIAHSIAPIDMDKKQVANWIGRHILKKHGVGVLSFNQTHLKCYDRLSFYTIKPFCFSMNHYPDETMSEFSLLVDCGADETTGEYILGLLRDHFAPWGTRVTITYGSTDDMSKIFAANLTAITGGGSDLHEAMYKHDVNTQKQMAIVNLNMKRFKKHQYFNYLLKFLCDYADFTRAYANNIKIFNIKVLTARGAEDITGLFLGQEN